MSERTTVTVCCFPVEGSHMEQYYLRSEGIDGEKTINLRTQNLRDMLSKWFAESGNTFHQVIEVEMSAGVNPNVFYSVEVSLADMEES